MDRVEFAKCMAVLSEGCGERFDAPSGGDGQPSKTDVWYDCLKHHSAEALQTAVRRFLLEDGKFVSIAKLNALAAEAEHGALPSAPDAFEQVLKAVRRYGSYEEAAGMASLPELSRRAVRMIGGWQAICASTQDQRGTLRAQFRDAYNAGAEQEQQRRRLPEALQPRLPDESPRAQARERRRVERLTRGIGRSVE